MAAVVSCAAVPCPRAVAAAPSCGKRIAKPSGGRWKCAFADDFKGHRLARTKWRPMTTATTGFTMGGECDVDDPGHIRVGHGVLTLTVTKGPSKWCGWYPTPYQSGMVFTKYAQAYGRFEARVKFPAGERFASGFWMWPKEMAYGKQSGEIDIAEHFGAYPSSVTSHIHIIDGIGDRGTGGYCDVADPAGRFHKYTVEWLPTGFRFLYDGVPCETISSWDPPSPLIVPQPFDQPFFMLLTLALGNKDSLIGEGGSDFPASMQVDYVRAWK